MPVKKDLVLEKSSYVKADDVRNGEQGEKVEHVKVAEGQLGRVGPVAVGHVDEGGQAADAELEEAAGLRHGQLVDEVVQVGLEAEAEQVGVRGHVVQGGQNVAEGAVEGRLREDADALGGVELVAEHVVVRDVFGSFLLSASMNTNGNVFEENRQMQIRVEIYRAGETHFFTGLYFNLPNLTKIYKKMIIYHGASKNKI